MDDKQVAVKVWGPYACFSRDEASVERVSYEVMTPAAARNILRSIFWKPEFDWEVRQIEVLNPIRWAQIARNEVGDKATPAMVFKENRYLADDTGARSGETQRRVLRSGVVLADVCYVVRARLALEPHAYHGEHDPLSKYRAMFERRLSKGQCFSQPYLGMRDHHAFFERPDGEEQPQDLTMDLGPMRYDVVYEEHEKGPVRVKKHPTRPGEKKQRVKALPRAVYFNARLERGVMRVPPREMVLKAAGVRNPLGWTIGQQEASR